MHWLPCECDRLLLCLAKTLGLFSRSFHRASHGILDIGLFLNMSHDSGLWWLREGLSTEQRHSGCNWSNAKASGQDPSCQAQRYFSMVELTSDTCGVSRSQ